MKKPKEKIPLLTKEEERKIIKDLCKHNIVSYSLIKASEEASELTTAILQYVNKRGLKTTLQDVTDEIGDLEIRIACLKEHFKIEEEVEKRKSFKLRKFKQYLKENKYKNI